MRLVPGLLAALLWLAAGRMAAAASLTDTVPGHAGVRFFDLMKLVIPDLAPDGRGGVGSRTVPFKAADGKDAGADPPATITLDTVDVMAIPGQPDRVILLADLGPSEGNVADAVVLALFALAPAPRLLDVAEVGLDRYVSFGAPRPALLAPGAPLILIDNTHSDADENFTHTEAIFVRGSRFFLITDLYTLNDYGCTFRRDQDAAFSTLADAGPYRAVHVRVRQTITLTHDACNDEKPPRAGVTTYQATWRWDEKQAAFVTHSPDLARLAKQDPQ